MKEKEELRQAFEQAETIRRNLSLALEGANAGIFYLNIPDDILEWDFRSLEMFDTTLEDFGGNYEAWASFIHPEDIEFKFRSITLYLGLIVMV